MKNFYRHARAAFYMAGLTLALAVFTGCPEDKKESAKTEAPAQTQAADLEPEIASEPVPQVPEPEKEEPEEPAKEIVLMSVADFDRTAMLIDPVKFSDYKYRDNPGIDPELYILGFSDDGKVAYSTWHFEDGKGGFYGEFAVQSLVTDKILFREAHDSEESAEWNPDGSERTMQSFLAAYQKGIDRALKDSKIQKVSWDFTRFPLSHDGATYDIKISSTVRKEENFFGQAVDYSVIMEKQGQGKKTLTSQQDRMAMDVFPCGCIISPLEERALVVYAEIGPAFENTFVNYIFTGSELGYGFK